jgi:hypothetical protein
MENSKWRSVYLRKAELSEHLILIYFLEAYLSEYHIQKNRLLQMRDPQRIIQFDYTIFIYTFYMRD